MCEIVCACFFLFSCCALSAFAILAPRRCACVVASLEIIPKPTAAISGAAATYLLATASTYQVADAVIILLVVVLLPLPHTAANIQVHTVDFASY